MAMYTAWHVPNLGTRSTHGDSHCNSTACFRGGGGGGGGGVR